MSSAADTADSDRRGFSRIRRSLSVRFKFLSSSVRDPEMERVFEGSTTNVSIGGLLLVGPVLRMDWVKDLLLGHIQVGVNLQLPGRTEPLKLLTRISWIEAKDPDAMAFRMGLRTLDMPPDHRKALSEFLMKETAIP